MPRKRKLNCWEYIKCGRELGGRKAKKLGVCPVAIDPYADGINQGTNGGRICWAVVSSYCLHNNPKCPAPSQGPFCFECDFHRKVLEEEGFIIKPGLLPQKKELKKRKQSCAKK